MKEVVTNKWFLIGVAIVVIVIIIFIAVNSDKEKADKNQVNPEDFVNDFKINSSQLSQSTNNLNQRIQLIFDSMNQVGTDEELLLNQFEGLNLEDVRYIVKGFGVRSYNGSGEAFKVDKMLGFYENLTLPQWIYEEDEAIFEELNNQYFSFL